MLQLDLFRPSLGQRFWKVSTQERAAVAQMFRASEMVDLATLLQHRHNEAPVELLDVAYWKKGCSSLGKARYAVMLDVDQQASSGLDLCLIDIKEAVKAAAPRSDSASMPHEYAQRVVAGAKQLSPHLGERMIATRLGDRSVFVRELLPADLKLEMEHIRPAEAKRAARYLANVVGRAHARQMDAATRATWHSELRRTQSKTFEAPSWLWKSVVELVGAHERAYLDHCRRYALNSTRDVEGIAKQPA